MSGPFGAGSLQYFSGGAAGFYPVSIDQSLRFNDDDSAYLSRTPASAGNRKTMTFSCWVKRCELGTGTAERHGLLTYAAQGAGSGNIGFGIYIDQLYIERNGVADAFATPKLRDVSAWYHIVLAIDTTQATANDRVKMYLNGEQILGTSLSYNQNDDVNLNNTDVHRIGQYFTRSEYADYYMAEVHFTDGTAYDADAFGELKSGVWVAKSPSVTYGTNGFHLDFANSADIGNDISGEGNDWTPNNFTASDVVSDSPTDNFCTWNPLNKGSAITLADGNLSFTQTSTWNGVTGTVGVSSGKWYFEYTFGGGTAGVVGVAKPTYDPSTEAGIADTVWRYRSDDGTKRNGGASSSAYGATWTNGDVIGVAYDLDVGEIEFYKNGVSQGVAFTNLAGETVTPVAGTFNSTSASNCNFGQLGFTYTPPTDYLALSTANLPEPTISPADDASPEDYFGTLLWSGDDNATRTVAVGQSGITGDVNFTPDFTWVKRRNGATNGSDHMLLDAVRGVGTFNALSSNGTQAEGFTAAGSAWANFGDIDSFTTDGFVVQKGSDPSHTLEGINQTGGTYVGWNWRLGGAPTVDNSAGVGAVPTAGSVKVDGSNYGSALAGSIAATRLSANTTSGCSIVTYTGTGSDGTIAHGLSQAPEMLVFRRRDADGTDHLVYHSALGAGKNLRHNNTDAENSNTTFFQNTAPTSTVFSIGGTALNTSGRTFVVYCFHSVEGFSKFGSYTGNGSADGPFVYTGFRPSWIMVKQSSASGEHWEMWDDKRSTYNINTPLIYANLTNAEGGNSLRYDVLSNGFKLRTTNAGANASATYIYMAFAENPFKYSLAR